jgi:hypothetical protein
VTSYLDTDGSIFIGDVCILAGAVDMVLPSYIDLTKTFPTYMLLRAP